MLECEILTKLNDPNGPDVSLTTLAHFCNCSVSAIKNYVTGKRLPNGEKVVSIREGLKRYKKLINEIIQE